MKIEKFYEYSTNQESNVMYYLKKIEADAEKGITPIESIEDEKLLKKLKKYFKYAILNATIVANNNKFKSTDKTSKDISSNTVNAEDHEFVLSTILNNLKNGIPLDKILKTEFPGENPNTIIKLLSDRDKEIINVYQRKMSNKPENQKRFNLDNIQRKYDDSVIDPFEIFSDSAPFRKYSDEIRKLKEDE